jgi:hypothetical protein
MLSSKKVKMPCEVHLIADWKEILRFRDCFAGAKQSLRSGGQFSLEEFCLKRKP